MNLVGDSSLQRIRHLFPDLPDNDLREILNMCELIEIETGDILIHQDTSADAYYYLTKGRLRAIQKKQGANIVLGDIGVGEPVGELAFFTGAKRMASVLAVRKSEVLKINKESFESIVRYRPQLASITHKYIIERLRRNELEHHKKTAPKNIAFLNLNTEEDIHSLTDAIQTHSVNQAVPINIHDKRPAPDVAPSDFFKSLEEKEGANLFVIDEKDVDWARKSCIYADLIVIAAAFNSSAELREIEQKLDFYKDGVLHKKIYLLLLHDSKEALPRNTDRWFENRNLELHIHVRRNHAPDISRLCRIITNRAVGLVLGGGGAKGFAHIGVVKAMMEKGIPIDFIGGTSAGAIHGITMAFKDFDLKKVEQKCEESVKKKITSNDLDVPVTSLLTGKKLTKFLKDMFGHYKMEDLWINSFCVTTNFSKAEMAVHERGTIWRSVRGSISIPGIFPPVVIDNYLHVDGAVMDNLPIEPMYRFPVSQIYAIALSSVFERKTNFDDTPTSKQMLASKWIGKKKKYKMPGIASIIINSLTLSSQQKQLETQKKVSHYLELNLKGVGFMDNKKWRSILKKGYQQTKEWLNHYDNTDTE